MGLFANLFDKSTKGVLTRFYYSPGYCDMLGACHYRTLEKNADGNWVFITGDREEHSEPMTIITYAVSPEAVSEFESFIKTSHFTSLANRPKNRGLISDYSPWIYNLDFDCSASGGSRNEYYSISEYREYTSQDDALVSEVCARFNALKGEKLSEVQDDG